jgi:hypothetical protein
VSKQAPADIYPEQYGIKVRFYHLKIKKTKLKKQNIMVLKYHNAIFRVNIKKYSVLNHAD